MVSTTPLQEREATPVSSWDHQGIVAEVRRRGSSLRRLSLGNGFAPSTLQASLYKRHPRANAIIADFLGTTRSRLWPAWYGPDDDAPHKKSRVKRS